jgi:hypothetical protein
MCARSDGASVAGSVVSWRVSASSMVAGRGFRWAGDERTGVCADAMALAGEAEKLYCRSGSS